MAANGPARAKCRSSHQLYEISVVIHCLLRERLTRGGTIQEPDCLRHHICKVAKAHVEDVAEFQRFVKHRMHAVLYATDNEQVGKVLKAIEVYKEDELAKFISTMDGAEKAKTELAKLNV